MKLLQLVNRTILALLVFACFSFTQTNFNKTSNKNNYSSNNTTLQIKYYNMHIYPNSHANSEEIRECLSEKFIFISLLNSTNTIGEIWKVRYKHHTTTGVSSNDPEEAEIPCHFPYHLTPYTDPDFGTPTLRFIK
ncbi:hypothetical protein [uncultured Tenacibaculum sp.]|uniref:hypothetical protein n=1 Tax=uncultured Tenacibaculum sp. TaxID=174713 RepID=UPI00261E98BC|nr:hypothetical protein [uncultured Tenacibaculum sp.]